ncbi:hypothetical protein CLOBOL_00971 [Enterocloster bolteae ATCC BAA-613]|uniref:Uncharacterized protein n=1 Tax=Enterocloster bolteae (strain ATCC BAA-613 / DSM 15670 / CCUG 46953 / JCM 12243 / WAL 16351) TaxID=411902 RepID=A8RJN5_ENTBW|nr:hypothetical protein CLOBOL_00971 [Enterocloster bolteae ATCC BAA-613]
MIHQWHAPAFLNVLFRLYQIKMGIQTYSWPVPNKIFEGMPPVLKSCPKKET